MRLSLPAVSRIALAIAAAASSILVSAPTGATYAASAASTGLTRGRPWTGPHGVTQTVAQITARPGAATATHANVPARRLPTAKRSDPAAAPASGGSAAHAADAVAPRSPQTVATSFLGGTLGEAQAIPPDAMGAAGPTQFLVVVNGLIRTFTKAGAADGVLSASTDVFFAPVLVAGNVTSDPRVRYDRLTGRWFITMVSADPNAGDLQPANRLLLAVSSGSAITPSSSFTLFAFQQDAVTPGPDAGCFLDYDTLGIDVSALYVGGNFFCVSGNQSVYKDSSAFVIRKTSVLGGGPMVVTAFRNLTNGVMAGPFTPQGADNDDSASVTGYLVGVDVAAFGDLKLRRISDPGGTPSISGNIDIPVGPTAFPIPVPHQGSDGRPLDAVDDRLMNAVVRRHMIWTIQNIGVNSAGVGSQTGDRDGTRWYQIGAPDSVSPGIVQSGTVFDSSSTNPLSWWMPSINVSQQENVAIGGSVAGAAHFADAWTAGRTSQDELGVMGAPTVYTATNAAYNPVFNGFDDNPHRWGDFSFTSLDPNDGMTMWTIQEYTNAANSWGVRVARLLAPPPADVIQVVPATIPSGETSVNVRVTGRPRNGSAFFDPGPGFANRMTASVGGGVSVNSVRFESVGSVVLNLNTSAAAQGPVDVAITNPDGQTATGGHVLTIGPATGTLRVTTDPAVASQISVSSPGGQCGAVRDSWGLNFLSLPAGTYQVCFTHVEGFTESDPISVTIPSAHTIGTGQGHFTRRGELHVVTNPAVAAPISVDGVVRNDWGMFTDLPAGSHQVCFGPAAGFDPPTPACQTITLNAAQLTTVTGNYTSDAAAPGPQGTGQLRVTTSPALPSQILVNGVPMDSFGLTWVDLAPGTYTVSFTHVEGFTEPAPQTVTVTAGQTTVLQGNFVQRGSLRVLTSPAVPATISLDGVAMDNFGMWTDVPVGGHTVCYGWAPGEVPPPCDTVTVTAGALTTVTGTYTSGP